MEVNIFRIQEVNQRLLVRIVSFLELHQLIDFSLAKQSTADFPLQMSLNGPRPHLTVNQTAHRHQNLQEETWSE